MLRLYLLRHGESTHSREGRMCGAGTDAPLTEEGRAMAKHFASAYSSLTWERIIVSPLSRAQETAAPLCRKLGIDPEVRSELREINYGSWEGKLSAEVEGADPAGFSRWVSTPAFFAPPGGESGYDVQTRICRLIEEVCQRYGDCNVLLVSHKTTIRVALAALLGIDLTNFRARLACPVCSLSIVEFAARGPMLIALGDRHHLPENLRDLPGS